ncbi:hypothetical protein Tco_0858028 [Tanacetum coccineum]|uniref:Uncharacterized protein n=1 Tax=Tanacetum coccineum TaxID=301880 RepID=A0ABQ5B7V9_9ASTR
MDNPNITMEEYIRLKEEKAHRRGKVYNWKTAKYGKIWSGSQLDTTYPSVGYGVLGISWSTDTRIFLDGYGVLVFRIVIFKISSFKL